MKNFKLFIIPEGESEEGIEGGVVGQRRGNKAEQNRKDLLCIRKSLEKASKVSYPRHRNGMETFNI